MPDEINIKWSSDQYSTNNNISEILEGQDSESVTAKGKKPGVTNYGVRGINDYTGWFAGDTDMSGNYGGYDGPCPPWNDERIHNYEFTVYALDVESLNLGSEFQGAQVLKALEGHVLDQASWSGWFSLNPEVL